MTYTNPQVVLHWLTALLIVMMIATGAMYSNDVGGDLIIDLHQIAGQALIVVLMVRLAVRLRHGTPPPNPDHPLWERRLAHLIHILLYVALIVFVITGYVSASAFNVTMLLFPVDIGFARSDFGEVLLEVHFAMKFVLGALLLLHLGGAFKHLLIDRDGTLSRMWFSRSSQHKDT